MVDGPEESPTVYSFGETELAARRLGVVARIFDPVSENFVSESLTSRPRLALDLGCGTGFTTRLLARVAEPENTVGVDRSEDFLEHARADAGASESYIAADITDALPRLGGVPDLIYLRLLASHLRRPEQEISRWTGELASGGLLLVEDVESIVTEISSFERYLEIVAAMLEHHGNELYVGPRLAAEEWKDNVSVEMNRVVEVSPAPNLVARMFRMNLQSWRHDPYIEANHSRGELDRLAGELERLAKRPSTGSITWRLRQISLRQTEEDALI
jgi:SAM-dependent methyltransferase